MQIYPLPYPMVQDRRTTMAADDINAAIAEAGATDSPIFVLPWNSNEPELRQVELVRRFDATHAYCINNAVAPRPLSHGDLQWGDAFRGYILPRQHGDELFLEPTPPNQTVRVGRPTVPLVEVIIKRLIRDVVEWELEEGSEENPFVAIQRLQEIGDDVHILRTIDALQNTEYIYFISRFCERVSLGKHYCPLRPEPNLQAEGRARIYFRQMLDSLHYIHSHGICHQNIDPSNFLVTDQGRVLLCDMAISFPISQGGGDGPVGRCGKPSFLPPEVFLKRPFDARQSDLWACIVSLFNLLTGMRPYNLPHPGDVGFRYIVLANAFAKNISNERVLEVLQDMDYTADTFHHKDISDSARVQISFWETMTLATLVPTVIALSPQIRELFHHSLRMNPDERWTVERIRNCEWMTMDLPEP